LESVDENHAVQAQTKMKTEVESCLFSAPAGAKSDAKTYKRVRTRFVNNIVHGKGKIILKINVKCTYTLWTTGREGRMSGFSGLGDVGADLLQSASFGLGDGGGDENKA
jgi:hypothetical protein